MNNLSLDEMFTNFCDMIGTPHAVYSEFEEDMSRLAFSGVEYCIGQLDDDNIDPYVIDSPLLHIEAEMISKDDTDDIHYNKTEPVIIADHGPEWPYDADKRYSRLNFHLLPDISAYLWDIVDSLPEYLSLKSIPSQVLEDAMDPINYLDVFGLPTMDSSDEITVTHGIKGFYRRMLSSYLTKDSRILWLKGDGTGASRYTFSVDGTVIPIDCLFFNDRDVEKSKGMRIVPGDDFLYKDDVDYDLVIANYYYFDYEEEIESILLRNRRSNCKLLYITVSPDSLETIYNDQLMFYDQTSWVPDAKGLAAGFKVITREQEGRVWTWCHHGTFSDRVWSRREGTFSKPLYEFIEEGSFVDTFNHPAFKHFIFSIRGDDTVLLDVSRPNSLLEVEVRDFGIHNKESEEYLGQAHVPDATYLGCYYKSQFVLFDVFLDIPFFSRRRWLKRFVKIPDFVGDFKIRPLSSYNVVKFCLDDPPIGAERPMYIEVHGLAYNYSLRSVVNDVDKFGYLFHDPDNVLKNCFRVCVNDIGNLEISSTGRFKLWLPFSYSVERSSSLTWDFDPGGLM